jgi:hypothetical protein
MSTAAPLQTATGKPPQTSGANLILQRKCACGARASGLAGECAECSKKKLGLQTKLRINEPGDVYEQEADRVAEQVLAMPAHPDVSKAPTLIQRYTGQSSAPTGTAPASVDRVLASPGRPLEATLRQDMEQRFGHDFSRVRVHSGAAAEQSARDVDASAYTVGHDIVFGAGRFAPATHEGQRLIAHELTHVVQQAVDGGIHVSRRDEKSALSPIMVSKNSDKRIMRKGFESTIKACYSRETRNFEVTEGGVRVVLLLDPLNKTVPLCDDFDFGVTLTRSEDWWPDDEIATCTASTGGSRAFSFGKLSRGTYYLTIWSHYGHPHCCVEGDILVFDEAVSSDSTGCKRDKDPTAMDIVHGALDIAGFIPVLGAIPDGVNAAIYVVEGDWANAGLSAVAMVPAWGDGVKLGTMAGKTTIKVSEKAAIRLGEEGIALGLKEVKAASKVEKATLETTEDAAKLAKAEKEAAEGAVKAEKEGAEAAAKAEKEAAEKKGKKKKDEKKGQKGKWGCMDVRCNVYPDPQAKPPNKNCPDRVIGEAPYIFPSFDAACKAAQVAANLLVPRGCIKRHCNCNTKCTKK